MATATPIKKAGTDKDGRLLKNRPLTPRQAAVLRFIDAHGPTNPSDLGRSAVFRGELYATDKARRSLTQLAERGMAQLRKDGNFSLTAKGKRAASK